MPLPTISVTLSLGYVVTTITNRLLQIKVDVRVFLVDPTSVVLGGKPHCVTSTSHDQSEMVWVYKSFPYQGVDSLLHSELCITSNLLFNTQATVATCVYMHLFNVQMYWSNVRMFFIQHINR